MDHAPPFIDCFLSSDDGSESLKQFIVESTRSVGAHVQAHEVVNERVLPGCWESGFLQHPQGLKKG
jgi:hypothetical protein